MTKSVKDGRFSQNWHRGNTLFMNELYVIGKNGLLWE